jgi:peroxiredoxin
VDQFTAMAMVTRAYSKDNKNYNLYQQELTLQKNNYSDFQKSLLKKEDYASDFLRIVNLTNGLGAALKENEEDNGKEIVRTITEDISLNALFTSGHWDSVIEMFTALEDKKDGGTIFLQDFKRIGDRISDAKLYTAFAERITYYLTKSGNDNIIKKLSPIILDSGKVTSYAGVMSVYQKATVGGKAPKLTIHSQKNSDQSPKVFDFSDKNYKKTLVVFYLSDCGHCDAVMKELSAKQDELIKSGVRLVAISADTDRKVFEESSKNIQWKGLFSCDLQGLQGPNFMNYGVQATPTLFVIDQQGNIVTREGATEPALKALADPSTELWRKIRKPPRPYVEPQQ